MSSWQTFVTILINSAVLVNSRFQSLPSIDTYKCGVGPTCDPQAKYRNLDGSCSNLKHSTWGQAARPFLRILPPTYQDGNYAVRSSVNGTDLPNARLLSSCLLHDSKGTDKVHTLNLMQFGQMATHDISHILNQQTDDKKEISCCVDGHFPPSDVETNPACMPISISRNDYFFSQFNVTCMDFVRARITVNGTCSTFPAQQVNLISSVIDANWVYGIDIESANNLRAFNNGLLKVQYASGGRQFPPQSPNPDFDCLNPPSEQTCYISGDDRVNQNVGISLFHVMFLRVHNIICERLSILNPHWDDETLYQEARKIIGALNQFFIYNEYLPIILGKHFMKKKGISLEDYLNDCSTYHDPDVKPSTFNEFAASAFRSFHSSVPQEIDLYGKNLKPYKSVNMDDHYFRPSIVQQKCNYDSLLRGLTNQPQNKQDQHFSVTLTNLLFKGTKPYGLDLESADIQRGREHGLPTYNQMRVLCGLKEAYDFEDFSDVMTNKSIETLKEYYWSVKDVDLFIGGLFEKIIPGTQVGYTNQCIIGEQFYNLMVGDRFFFLNCDKPWSFTQDQIDAICQTSIAWIFCQGGDNIKSIQKNTFLKPSQRNPVISCSQIPDLDLSAWKEEVDEFHCE